MPHLVKVVPLTDSEGPLKVQADGLIADLRQMHPGGKCKFCHSPLSPESFAYVNADGATVVRVVSKCAADDHHLGLEGVAR